MKNAVGKRSSRKRWGCDEVRSEAGRRVHPGGGIRGFADRVTIYRRDGAGRPGLMAELTGAASPATYRGPRPPTPSPPSSCPTDRPAVQLRPSGHPETLGLAPVPPHSVFPSRLAYVVPGRSYCPVPAPWTVYVAARRVVARSSGESGTSAVDNLSSTAATTVPLPVNHRGLGYARGGGRGMEQAGQTPGAETARWM